MTAASLLGGATATLGKHPSATTAARQGLIVAKASREDSSLNLENSRSGRRELVFAAAAAAAAACSLAKIAMADEPKPGTPEAKKKYAAICVTMPTARICHK